MLNGELLSDYFTREFGITPQEFAKLPGPKPAILTPEQRQGMAKKRRIWIMREVLETSTQLFIDALNNMDATPDELLTIAMKIQVMANTLILDQIIVEKMKIEGLLN